MQIRFHAHESSLRYLSHGKLRILHQSVGNSFTTSLYLHEADLNAGVELSLDPKTLKVTPAQDWNPTGLVKIPAVNCLFGCGLLLKLEKHSDYLVFCEFFGVQPLPLISDHFHLFDVNAFEG